MAFVPEDARWYLADVVLEHIVQGDRRNVVHVNTLLIEADSPERAHKKARALGRNAEGLYENSDGKEVRVIFRGLRELNVIHEPPEHGAELTYEEHVSVPERELAKWVSRKKSLAVFRERESSFAAGDPNLDEKAGRTKERDGALFRSCGLRAAGCGHTLAAFFCCHAYSLCFLGKRT